MYAPAVDTNALRFSAEREAVRAAVQRFMGRGFLLAFVIHVFVLAGIMLGQYLLAREPKEVTLRMVRFTELGPPPSLAQEPAPKPVVVTTPIEPPKVGIPKPVPKSEVQEETIATQQELSEMQPLVQTGTGSDSLVVEEERFPGMFEFVPTQEIPLLVQGAKPAYPEFLKKAGVEGRVQLRLLVDKQGKVREVAVVKSSGYPAMDEAARTAAWEWVFRPAINNNKPIAVWVTLPVDFKLK